MGTPREYGFNDISKEKILKADPPSLFFFFFVFAVVLVHSDPFLAGKSFSVWRERGATTQVLKTYSSVCEADPATLTYSCASLCQDSCIMSR